MCVWGGKQDEPAAPSQTHTTHTHSLFIQCCLGSKSATWGCELLVMAGRERSVAAACSDGDSHLEKRLWHSFASKQSNKSLWRRYSTEGSSSKQTNICSGEGTFLLYSFLSFISVVISLSCFPSAWHLCLSSLCLTWNNSSILSLTSPLFFVLTSLISVNCGNELAEPLNLFLRGNPSQETLCLLLFLSNFHFNCPTVQHRLCKSINTFKYNTTQKL